MYKKILIHVGRDSHSRAAVTEGVELAQVHGSEVVFFSVLRPYATPVTELPVVGLPTADEFMQQERASADRMLAAATVVADRAGVRSRTAVGSGGDDAECIVDTARRRRCSLIVAASRGGHAILRLFNGSVIPGLVSHSTIPVLVVRQQERRPASTREVGVIPPARGPRRRAATAMAERWGARA